jgi:hypothetical protein
MGDAHQHPCLRPGCGSASDPGAFAGAAAACRHAARPGRLVPARSASAAGRPNADRSDLRAARLLLGGVARRTAPAGAVAGGVGGARCAGRRCRRRPAACLRTGRAFRIRRRVGGNRGRARTAANHAVVVSRLAGRRMARGTGHSSGRALAVHGASEASARQRQSTWFRLRGLALRTRPAGNGLRAPARGGAASGRLRTTAVLCP